MFSLVLPFHSDLTSIGRTVAKVREEGGAHGIGEVLLAHNGEPLDDAARAHVEALVAPAEAGKPSVRLLDTPAKGLGAGYKIGIAAAEQKYIVLSADDLPFGFSDVDAFERAGRPEFAIGSKAHPWSVIAGINTKRRLSSFAFLSLRRALLGKQTPGDSQGSVMTKTSIAKELLPDLQYDHYLSSLEILTLWQQRGGRVTELPITIQDLPHTSSVSVVRDGVRMTRELVALRARIKRRS